MAHPFDVTLKEILVQAPEDFAPVFGLPCVTPAQALNVDLSTISAATDVAFGFGRPLQEIVDLNFQSGPDPTLDSRMHLYNAAYHLKHGVPVRSVAVLLRPKADSATISGTMMYVAGSKRVQFEYDVIRMWQQPVDAFLKGGLGILPLATLCQVSEGKPIAEWLRDVVREIDRRLAEEQDHSRAVRLMTAAFILTGMRAPKATLGSIYDGVRIMHESTAYDMILDEGEVKRSHKMLVRLGTRRFGPPHPQVEATLTAIQDLERLEHLEDAVLTATSWDELIATP